MTRTHDSEIADATCRWLEHFPRKPRAEVEAVLASLVTAYTATGRHYHDLAHIGQLLRLAALEGDRWIDRRSIDLAIYFHDAVYEIGRRDNEDASARLAVEALTRLGVEEATRERVAQLIEATAHVQQNRPPGDHDLDRFLDLDLSILAAPAEAYEAYAAAIRREYEVIPDDAYRTGRASILRSFLARPRLFRCDDHHAAWDAPARANLDRELASLIAESERAQTPRTKKIEEERMSREKQRARGQELRAELGLARGKEQVPGLDDFLAEVVYAGIWDRPGLAKPDRAICTLAALSVLQRLVPLKAMTGSALDLGLTPRNILEVFVQVGLYAGFVTTETSAAVAHEVFAARGLKVPAEPARTDSHEELDRLGREVMAKLHGERGTQGYAAPGNAITGELYPSAIRYGYGELWSRPGLDHRQRMLCAVAGFCAMGLESQLKKFGQSALNVGLTRQEIIEAVIQTGPYGGFPRALNGLAILSEVL